MISKIKTQIIIAGIGGQGVLFASRVFSELGLKLGLGVLGSETHGMSQRGGSVVAHLKLGDFHSSLIRTGTADILYSSAEDETYQNLKFLKDKGVCFVNMKDPSRFDPAILSHLKQKGIVFRAFDGGKEALRIGSVRSANIVLIGYSVGSGLVPYGYGDVRSVLESISRKKDRQMNLKAFDLGFANGKA